MNMADGNSVINTKEQLIHWIRERYSIHTLKDIKKLSRPWSLDPVFRTTYFCNVHREDDKVTKFLREFNRLHWDRVSQWELIYNVVMQRYLNWPDTISALGWQGDHRPKELEQFLQARADAGKQVWGGAYLITSNGMSMPKTHYLAHHIMTPIADNLNAYAHSRTCSGMSIGLQVVRGLGTFLAGQIVADLKNTVGSTLYGADDKATFVVPGVGSLRGASWFHFGSSKGVTHASFPDRFAEIRAYVDAHWPEEVPPVDNQDLQNCLCEYDKYLRVKTGVGKSKRNYNG